MGFQRRVLELVNLEFVVFGVDPWSQSDGTSADILTFITS